jgi:transposase-like protein
MARFPRKSDGRRIFTSQFKREQIGRVLRGELTLADLSRKLSIAPSLLQRWKNVMSPGRAIPSASGRFMTSVSSLRADQYIRELQLLVGKQTLELEILRAEMDALKHARRVHEAHPK